MKLFWNPATKMVNALATGPVKMPDAVMSDSERESLRLRAAWEAREEHETFVYSYADMAGGRDFLRRERWENFLRNSKKWPPIAEIVHVRISATQDTHEPVVTLGTPRGEQVTLWLTASGDVRSITGY